MAANPKPSSESFSDLQHEHRAYRLRPDHVEELQAVARAYEETDAGLKSVAMGDRDSWAGVAKADALAMHALSDAEERARIEDIGRQMDAGLLPHEMRFDLNEDDDVGPMHLFAAERWCGSKLEVDRHADLPRLVDRKRAHERRQRCRRALRALHAVPNGDVHIGTLHTVYGWKDPFALALPEDVLGRWNDDATHPLAGLARYTDAVERVRVELVNEEGDRAFERAGLAGQASRLRWFTATQKVFLMAAWIGERRAYADRVITSTDAVRHALRVTRARHADESEPDFRARHLRAQAARAAFVTDVKLEASNMLRDASLAYHEAWLRS